VNISENQMAHLKFMNLWWIWNTFK